MIVERLDVRSGARRWLDVLAELGSGHQDVYFRPDYHELHVVNGDGDGVCHVFREDDKILMVPGLRIRIDSSACDLQTCNGYGGPIASENCDTGFLEHAWGLWRERSADDGVIAGFFRLHPLINNDRWLPHGAVVRPDRQTVYVDLGEGINMAWQKADGRHRNRVRKSRACNCSIEWNSELAWDSFPAHYAEAMDRLGAPAQLRFSSHYFQRLRHLKGAHIAAIWSSDRLAAAAIYLFGEKWGHYHLGARIDDGESFLMNALFQAGLETAEKMQLSGLHFGGGRSASPEDTLLRFKRRLGGQQRTFQVALVIADNERFDSICSKWRTRSGGHPQWLLPYRQPTDAC